MKRLCASFIAVLVLAASLAAQVPALGLGRY